MRKLIIVFIVSMFVMQDISAQNPLKGKYRRFSVDIAGGIPYIHGDIKNEFTGYDISGRLNYHLTSAIAIGGEVGFGSVKGYDNPNRYFTNQYIKVLAGGEIYLFDMFRMHHLSNWFQPYLGVNVGAIKSNIKKSQFVYRYDYWTWIQHFNAGFKFKLTKMVDLNISGSFMLTGTDMLDNYGVKEPANKSKDALSTMKIGLTFHIGKKENKSIIWKDERSPIVMKDDSVADVYLIDDSTALYTKNKLEELEGKVSALERRSNEMNIKIVTSVNEVDNLGAKVGNVEKKTMVIEEKLGNKSAGYSGESSIDKSAYVDKNDENTFYFGMGSFTLSQDEISKLNTIANFLKANPNEVISISGHTDRTGEESFNLSLSLKRAESVKEQLMILGISSDRIETYGFGKSYLLPEPDQKNRRAVIQVK